MQIQLLQAGVLTVAEVRAMRGLGVPAGEAALPEEGPCAGSGVSSCA